MLHQFKQKEMPQSPPQSRPQSRPPESPQSPRRVPAESPQSCREVNTQREPGEPGEPGEPVLLEGSYNLGVFGASPEGVQLLAVGVGVY